MTDQTKNYRTYLYWFWGIVVAIFVFFILLFWMISRGYMGFMPTFEDLENPNNNVASEVYSTDKALLGTYYIQNRTFVNFDELSPNIVNALIATEDIRFTKHPGIDVRGLARVLLKTIMLGNESAGGGSTITQQLAKNLFPRDTVTYDSTIARGINLVMAKFKEWVTAVKLERNYTKEEILVMYLNTVPFGSQSYGIKAAAQTFFNKSPHSLKAEEAAILVGVLKAPSWYSPVRNTARALKRRNVVLSQMEKYNYISEARYDSIVKLPIELDYKVQNHNVGPATYFRAHLRNLMNAERPRRKNYASYYSFMEDSVEWERNPLYGWCNKNAKPDGEPYNLFRDGLKIYTTLDSRMQKYAEQAIAEHLGKELQQDFFEENEGREKAPFSNDLEMGQVEELLKNAMRRTDRYWHLARRDLPEDSILAVFNTPVEMKVFSWDGEKDTTMTPLDSIKYYKHFLRAGFMSMNPRTGHVKAYVGGIGFKHFKFDHVAKAKRQVGSTMKPFVYTLAMQEGHTPCDRVPNVPTTFYINDTTWTPKNSAGLEEYLGKYVTLKWGLANSVNYITAWIMKQYNPYAVIDIMRKMGITSYIEPVPSIALGTCDISLYEMVSAYSTYANKGVHVEPVYVTRIEDRNNNVIATFKPRKMEAISEETAYLMLKLLQEVVNSGTGIRLRFRYEFTNEIGGKTGTTQNQSDGWFMGVTPQLVSGAWVGGEVRSIHFRSIAQGQGANMALPIWALYMKKVYDDPELNIMYDAAFDKPKGFNVKMECDGVKDKKPDGNYPDYNDYMDQYY